ncbi:hypothetical protein F5B20DRAFT_586764 [Whalleya microplaca]|nr:hypothetical protein F5B20DRAFT_586764 [Whalleya microplaca]
MRTVEQVFTSDSPRFRDVRLLGKGANGTAHRIKEIRAGEVERNYVVKSVEREADVEKLNKEIQLSTNMYGAMHSSQVIVRGGELLAPNSVLEDDPPQRRIYHITELIQNVSLEEFLEKAVERQIHTGVPIPNRVLWMIFLCLVRMIMGMARPPKTPLNQSPASCRLEVLEKDPAPTDYQIYHGDLEDFNNLIFGDIDLEEHRLMPILKAIDFGRAVDTNEKTSIVLNGMTAPTLTSGNLYHIGRVMQGIIGHRDNPDWRILFPNLDEDLYTLVQRCVVADGSKRPSVIEVFNQVNNAVATKTGPDSFPGKPNRDGETDFDIQLFVSEVVLSAEYRIAMYSIRAGASYGTFEPSLYTILEADVETSAVETSGAENASIASTTSTVDPRLRRRVLRETFAS